MNSSWSLSGAARTALASNGIDSLKITFLADSQIQFTYRGSGMDTATNGLWWKTDANHFEYLDTADAGLGLMCSNTDTAIVEYAITADTLTMVTITDDCSVRGSLLQGSKWIRSGGNAGIKSVINKAYNISLSPNPVNDILNIKLYNSISQERVRIILYNSIGVKVYEDWCTLNNNNTTIDLKYALPGVYYLNICDTDNKQLITPNLILKR